MSVPIESLGERLKYSNEGYQWYLTEINHRELSIPVPIDPPDFSQFNVDNTQAITVVDEEIRIYESVKNVCQVYEAEEF